MDLLLAYILCLKLITVVYAKTTNQELGTELLASNLEGLNCIGSLNKSGS